MAGWLLLGSGKPVYFSGLTEIEHQGKRRLMVKKVAAKDAAGGRMAMSDAHKAALAQGRTEGRAVRRYLEALADRRVKGSRKQSRESLEQRLAAVEKSLSEARPLDRLLLIQERLDLREELTGLDGGGADLDALEEGFVAAAGPYGARRGISYQAWREAGVPAEVLRRAGIVRSR